MPIKTPENVREQLKRVFAAKAMRWLAAQAFGFVQKARGEDTSEFRAATDQDLHIDVSLGKLTQKEAAGNLLSVKSLCRDWRNFVAKHPGWTLVTKAVRWSTLGLSIEIPAKLHIDNPASLCAALSPGGISQSQWLSALNRLQTVADFFQIAVTENHFRSLFEVTRLLKNTQVICSDKYGDDDFYRLLQLIQWLINNPNSDVFVREIPVEGLDTKWLERHLKEVHGLFNIVREQRFGIEPCKADEFFAQAGLRIKPLFIRVRHAQDWRAGQAHAPIQLTLDELKQTAPTSQSIVIIENEQTGLSLDIDADVPILIGMGYGVAVLSQVDWLKTKRIIYFGDLDTHGLAIVSELRAAHPQAESVLMNCQTLKTYRCLAVTESKQVQKLPEHLTDDEKELFTVLENTKLRLEQERIPIDVINSTINSLLKSVR